jgi:hypothetical protein
MRKDVREFIRRLGGRPALLTRAQVSSRRITSAAGTTIAATAKNTSAKTAQWYERSSEDGPRPRAPRRAPVKAARSRAGSSCGDAGREQDRPGRTNEERSDQRHEQHLEQGAAEY